MKKKLVVEIEIPFPDLPGNVQYKMHLDHSVAIDEDDVETAHLLTQNFYKPSGSYSNEGGRKLLFTKDFVYIRTQAVRILEEVNGKENETSR